MNQHEQNIAREERLFAISETLERVRTHGADLHIQLCEGSHAAQS
jgi:hypothetical protein